MEEAQGLYTNTSTHKWWAREDKLPSVSLCEYFTQCYQLGHSSLFMALGKDKMYAWEEKEKLGKELLHEFGDFHPLFVCLCWAEKSVPIPWEIPCFATIQNHHFYFFPIHPCSSLISQVSIAYFYLFILSLWSHLRMKIWQWPLMWVYNINLSSTNNMYYSAFNTFIIIFIYIHLHGNKESNFIWLSSSVL